MIPAADARRLALRFALAPWPQLLAVEGEALRAIGLEPALGRAGYLAGTGHHGAEYDGRPGLGADLDATRRVLLDEAADDLPPCRWALRTRHAVMRLWFAAEVLPLHGRRGRAEVTARTPARALAAAAMLFRGGGGAFHDPATGLAELARAQVAA